MPGLFRDRFPFRQFRFPAMPPPWALTSLTKLRPGIPARMLWRQIYVSKPRILPRGYSTASRGANPEPDFRILADPERPDLFYHLFEPPSAISATNHVFGLSFLNTLESKDNARSLRIIGYLPASEAGRAIEAGLNDFKENRKSATFLWGKSIAETLFWQLGSGKSCTKRYAKGWRKEWMRCKRMVHASSRKGGCTSTVCLFATITLTNLGQIPEIVVLIRSRRKEYSTSRPHWGS